jgi:hypothetical protein
MLNTLNTGYIEDDVNDPIVVDRVATIDCERARAAAEVALNNLTEQEFQAFYLRAFYADYSEQGGIRYNCETWPWFPRIVHLFTGRDGKYLSSETMQVAGKIARQRGLVLSSEGPPPKSTYFAASSKPPSTPATMSPSLG